MKRYITTIALFSCMYVAVHADLKPDEIIEYKTVGEVHLTLHIFNPPDHESTNKSPAIVFFFGGGWIRGNPNQFYNQSNYLASRGMVAICADYRTYEKHKTSPKECVKDGKSAIRWVRSHADELGIDPNRIAAGGGSAGGHVAAATATLTDFNEEGEDTSISCRPDALILFNPVFDNGPEGFGYDSVKAYWKEFSPMHNISKETPPTIVFLGTEDELIPVETAEEYKKRMKEAGARCDLHLYQDQRHRFFNKICYYDTMLKTDHFLISLGYLKGTPTLENK